MKAAKLALIIVGAIILGVVLLIGTCAGGLHFLLKGPSEAGDKLVQLCGAHKYHEAYELTAPGLRATRDEAAFTAELQKLGLDRATSVSWSSRQINNSNGRVVGTVRLSDGRELPLEVRSVKEGGRWQITEVIPPRPDDE
jgi:hypothetical protein